MADLLQEALIAKENGDKTLAKQLISQALIQEPRNEAAWMLMSDVVEEVKLRRNCLERVLAINPDNEAARIALTRLNTSPLSPVSRGERDKPLNPPQVERIPPFTPPFTWESSQGQNQPTGDLTYPNLPGEPSARAPEVVQTFDWANESAEPDKTIQRIFDAVSNPDLASQALPDTDIASLENGLPAEIGADAKTSEGDYEAKLLDQLVGPDEEEPLPILQPAVAEDFTVNAEPELGLNAFTSPDEALETVSSDYRLWDNPKIKSNRMVILNNKSITYASPKESDVPHILGLFTEGKLLSDLLGKNTGEIKLDSIRRLTGDPKRATLTIDSRVKRSKISKRELRLENARVLDEVLEAMKVRLGVGFTTSIHTFSLVDKIVPPIVTLLFIIFIAWGLIAGLPLINQLAGTQIGAVQPLITAVQEFIAGIGVQTIFMIAAVGGLLTLIWLLNNLRQPSKVIILKRE